MRSNTLDTALVVRTTDQVCSEMTGEVMIFSPKSAKYFSLDGVGAKIWALVEKPISVSEICASICKDYDVQPEMCARDVQKFIEGLEAAGLVQVKDATGT